MRKVLLSVAVGLMAATTTLAADQLAFPGAAGWGRFAKGARATSSPTVYHVTNLNDSGTGSLRDAVSQPNRIVVFDVAGVINIKSRIVFSSNLYVAGQTAPGEGVTVYGNGVSFSGANNIICRYLRVRMGHGGDSGKDCAGISNGTNMIFDHCSFSWGLDETFSINPDGKGDLGSITLMNCIFGQGLLTHSAGGLIQADYITLYRNFYCDNSTRNNKIKGINQYANNIVYNWSNGCYIMGGDSEGASYVNIQSNLFINGPAKGGNCFGGANADFNCYGDDNWQDANIDGVFDPQLVTNYSASTRVSTPYDYPALDLYPGKELLTRNLPTVGASLPYRDQSDCYMVDEVLSYGAEGKLITYESSLPIGVPSSWDWYVGQKPTDSDGDGMPDTWEKANGTNPSVDDATVVASNGYLNIENYINGITADDRQFFLRKPITLALESATTSTVTLTWRDYTYAEDGFVVEILSDGGTWTQVARTAAGATSAVVEGLESAKQYQVRVAAFAQHDGKEVLSDYSTLKVTTRQIAAGVVDIDSYDPDLTLTSSQTVWDKEVTDWAEGRAFTDGDKVLLNTDGKQTLTVANGMEPAIVVVNGKGHLTLDGPIAGTGTSLNKGNSGTLVLNGTNTYTGATVLHQGTLEFNSIANGGEPSAIGASLAFPDNWLMDGGTYRYTGATATTDRSAKLTAPTKLEIANSKTTLTANGAFEGESDFELGGNGTLAVADATNFFAYQGETILTGGTLSLTDVENASKAFAKSNHQVVMNGGTMKFAYLNGDSQTFTFPIRANEGTTSTLYVPTHGTFNSDLTGSGTLEMIVPYLRFNIGTKLPNFSGRIIANGVPSSGSQSLFYHSSQWNSPNVSFTLKGKTYMGAWATNTTNYIGGLSGDAGTYLVGSSKQSKNFTCSWIVGGANTDEEFRGTICNLPAGLNKAYSGVVSISKVGTGLWRLTGTNDYAGTTTVEGGELVVNGTHTGTGAVTVKSGATLNGCGTIAATVDVQKGATLTAGDTEDYGKSLTLQAALTLRNGSTLRIPLYQQGTSQNSQNNIKATSSVTIESGVTLELDLSKVKTITGGTYFSVFASAPANISGTFTSISPAKPADGMEWDATELYTTGRLYIKGQGSQQIGQDEEDEEDDIEPIVDGVRTVLYSWQSPDGFVLQEGGVASMENAVEGANNSVNYQNGGNYTIVLNGKYGNMNDAEASSQSAYVRIGLDEPLQVGDSIFVTAYRNKGTGAQSSIYFDYAGVASVADNSSFGDLAAGESPTTIGYRIPKAASGVSEINLSRNTAGTNLFILKFMVTRWGEKTGVENTDSATQIYDGKTYNIRGQVVGDDYPGIVIRNGKKFINRKNGR